MGGLLGTITPSVELGQDFLLIGALQSPGRCTIKGLKQPRKIDEVDANAMSGATTKYIGTKLARFSALFEVWDWNDLVVYGKPFFALLLLPPNAAAPLALSVYHPVLADLRIDAVLVEEVSGWEQDEFGLWTREVKFVEWRKPTPALAVPVAAIPGATEAVAVAADANEERIQALQAAVSAAK